MNQAQKTIKPKRLKKNGNIGLIAPASPISEYQLAKAQESISDMGYTSCFSERILMKKAYLAGDDETRLKDLHEAFENKDIDAILCIRGGYGSGRIIDKIDFNIIRNNPKIIIGYSDITALLNSIWQQTGLFTFHGVVGTSPFTKYTKAQFKSIFSVPDSNKQINTEDPSSLNTINEGKANGQLVGGNLSIINSLIGTKYEIDMEGKLVFIEDVGEAPYKIDRMLTQLLLAEQLQKASGIIFGQFKSCDINNEDITQENSLSLSEVFHDRLIELDIPIVSGFSFGHIKNQAIFPIGAKAELNTNFGSIKILENAMD